MKVNVLGVKIDDVSMEEACSVVQGWLGTQGQTLRDKHYIVTPNSEIVMMAQKDLELKKILNKADLSIPDGVGLRLSGKVKNVVTGTDLMVKLVEMASEKGFTVGFLGGRGDVAKRCAECLKRKYPRLKVVFAENGGEVDSKGDTLSDYRLPTTYLLFVAFGPPKQEKWIAKNLDKIPVKVAMGVGGAFDYLSGRIPRAPKWMRSFGLEWLFRLIIQPWRIKRQLTILKYLWLIMVR